MKVTIPYGLKKIEIDLPETNNIKIVAPKRVSLGEKETMIKRALDNPFKCVPFVKWIKKKRKIIFVINDAARPTPTFDILKELGKKMNIEEAKYIIATGAHKEPGDRDLGRIFGGFYDIIKPNIVIHNAHDKKSLIELGTTSRGTEVWINKEIIDADAIIPIGSVEPHYFAGFTGGRKSFFPGLAGYITIEQNHKLALEEGTEPLSLAGNPVHLDLIDAFKKVPYIPIFSIQTVVKDNNDLHAVFCGDIHKSFSEACKCTEDIFSFSIKEKADIVITVARHPLDVNLYQAHKAIEHGKLALKDEGILILVAPCDDGIGPDNFYKLLSSSTDLEKILKTAKENYKLGYHKAARIAELSKKSEIWAVSEVENEKLKKIFIKPFDSLQVACAKTIEKKGREAQILILMDGGNNVPKVGSKPQNIS